MPNQKNSALECLYLNVQHEKLKFIFNYFTRVIDTSIQRIFAFKLSVEKSLTFKNLIQIKVPSGRITFSRYAPSHLDMTNSHFRSSSELIAETALIRDSFIEDSQAHVHVSLK
jgi:hypothetical protein